ncbi:MAG: hypothetical protein A2W19_17275 [Spirochaetes bacterium RBG_16_49_21]|nr:MAG: hypothetical protein A2W19_17275 [Spirochaetes bacterium RBG_16_49_21]
MQQLDYTVETKNNFEDTVISIEAKAQEKGFRVLAVHDVKATLESKGFNRDPLTIIEICNAKYASEVLAKDIKLALMLPCPICVYVEDNKTFISAMRPAAIPDFFPEADIKTIADEVDKIVVSILDEIK